IGTRPLDPQGTWFQPWQIAQEEVDPSSAVALGDASIALDGARGAAPLPGASDGEAKGGLVFAGYGISVPEVWDDDEHLDVKGKVVVVLRYAPGARPVKGHGPTPAPGLAAIAGRLQRAMTFQAKLAEAKKRGAVGMILATGARARPDDAFAMSWPATG